MTAMTDILHATGVVIDGRCVLLTGPSGVGKSDLALRLIDRGATLLADDYVELRTVRGKLSARAPQTIRGMIEVRGVGLVVVPNVEEACVALIVDLGEEVDRLPDPKGRALLGIMIPTVALAGFEASAPIKVEAALRLFGLALQAAVR